MAHPNIFSLRHSVARGYHWKFERECTEETAQQWLAIFRADEPDVTFVAQIKTPSYRLKSA